MAKNDDFEYALRAREQEDRIKRLQKRLKNAEDGDTRKHIQRSILDASHRLGR